MTNQLEKLLKDAKKIEMSPQQREAQRRSFVYGNTKIENDRITTKLANEVADRMANGRSE